MQLTAKTEMSSKEDQFQLSLLAAMGTTQRKEAADPLASKLNKVQPYTILNYNTYNTFTWYIVCVVDSPCLQIAYSSYL